MILPIWRNLKEANVEKNHQSKRLLGDICALQWFCFILIKFPVTYEIIRRTSHI